MGTECEWSPLSLWHSIFVDPLITWVTNLCLLRTPNCWCDDQYRWDDAQLFFHRSFQWWGTGMGVLFGWTLRPVAFLSSLVNGWLGQLLNAQDLKRFCNHRFKRSLLLSVCANGVLAGLWVIVVQWGHPNGGFPLSMVKMSSFKTENYERSVLRVFVSIQETRILMCSSIHKQLARFP